MSVSLGLPEGGAREEMRIYTVGVSNVVVETDTAGVHLAVRVTDMAEEHGAAILVGDVDVGGAGVEGHFCFLGLFLACVKEERSVSGVLQGLFIRWVLLPSPVVGLSIGG